MTNKFRFLLGGATLLSYFFISTIAVIGPDGDAQMKFAPVIEQRTETVNGGQCTAILSFKNNQLFKVESPNCKVVQLKSEKELQVNGKPLLYLNGSVTFGTGTSTCYGPPIPNPPFCVCTAQPCP
jgi:hypothetical protein